MRLIKYSFFLSFGTLLLMMAYAFSEKQQQSGSVCNSVDIRKQSREMFKPEFHYDASKSTYITFMNKKQFKELEVPLYIGEKYKVIFNTTSLPQDIDIEIYDKKYSSKSRTQLFNSKDVKEVSEGVYVFEPSKPMRRMYIDYSIPPTSGEIEKGCVIVTLGYKIKKL